MQSVINWFLEKCNLRVSDVDYFTSLDEMATVGWDERKGLLIQVNPSDCYIGGDYFKVFNATSEASASKVARINFANTLYTVHAKKWNRGKDNWWLNSREKKDLMAFLNAQNINHPQYTNWQYAILEFNNGKGLTYQQTRNNVPGEDGKLPYPDFLQYREHPLNYLELPDNETQNKQKKQAIERAIAQEKARQAPKVAKRRR